MKNSKLLKFFILAFSGAIWLNSSYADSSNRYLELHIHNETGGQIQVKETSYHHMGMCASDGNGECIANQGNFVDSGGIAIPSGVGKSIMADSNSECGGWAIVTIYSDYGSPSVHEIMTVEIDASVYNCPAGTPAPNNDLTLWTLIITAVQPHWAQGAFSSPSEGGGTEYIAGAYNFSVH